MKSPWGRKLRSDMTQHHLLIAGLDDGWNPAYLRKWHILKQNVDFILPPKKVDSKYILCYKNHNLTNLILNLCFFFETNRKYF